MVLVHIDSGAILVAAMKDCTSGEMIRVYHRQIKVSRHPPTASRPGQRMFSRIQGNNQVESNDLPACPPT